MKTYEQAITDAADAFNEYLANEGSTATASSRSKRQRHRVPTITERVAELIAEAPPMTDEQREAVVRLLARTPTFRGEVA